MGIFQLIRNFGTLSRRSLENPSIGLNDPEAWEEMFGGGRSEAGISVGANKALTIAAFWQGLSQISGDLARIPLLPYRIDDEENVRVDKSHPSYRIVRRKANRERAAFFVWRDFWLHALTFNKAFLWINRSGLSGRPIELVPLLPDRTAPGRAGGELYYETELDGSLIRLRADEVFHVQGPSIDWLDPPELVKVARNSLGLALQAENFESKFFANGVRAGGYLMIPPHWTEKAAKNLEEGLLSKGGKDSWFRTVIMRDGAKFEKASFTAQEMQMTEVRVEQVREVARWLNIAPSRLGLQDAVSYGSKSEDNRNYHDMTLSHWMSGMRAEAWDKLLTENEKDKDSYEFRHDTSELLSMSELERYQKHAIGVRTGIDTINEVRKSEGKPSVEWGDERPIQPGAAKPGGSEGNNGEGGADKDQKKPGDDEEEPKDPKDDESRQNPEKLAEMRLIFSLTKKARHKLSRSSNAFLEWIDGGLASFHREAREETGSDKIVSEFLQRALNIVETVGENELRTEIENLCLHFEKELEE